MKMIQWDEFGRTEAQMNTLNPNWTTVFTLEYRFEVEPNILKKLICESLIKGYNQFVQHPHSNNEFAI